MYHFYHAIFNRSHSFCRWTKSGFPTPTTSFHVWYVIFSHLHTSSIICRFILNLKKFVQFLKQIHKIKCCPIDRMKLSRNCELLDIEIDFITLKFQAIFWSRLILWHCRLNYTASDKLFKLNKFSFLLWAYTNVTRCRTFFDTSKNHQVNNL